MDMYVKKIIYSTASDKTKHTSFCQYNEITYINYENKNTNYFYFIKKKGTESN